MKLGETRRILSYIAMIIASVSSAVIIITTVLSMTLANPAFVKTKIVTDDMVNACVSQLEIKYSFLEAESNIPLRVFEGMADETTVRNTINSEVQNYYSDLSETENTKEGITNSFLGLCKEYLDGNKISYNESDVKHTAEKAADIFIETTSIKGLDGVAVKTANLKSKYSQLTLTGITGLVVSLLVLLIIYTNRKRTMFNFFCAMFTGSLAGSLAAVISLIARPALKLGITPEVAADSANKIMNGAFLFLLAASLGISVLCFVIVFALYKALLKTSE